MTAQLGQNGPINFKGTWRTSYVHNGLRVILMHCGPEKPQILLLDSQCSHEVVDLAACEENIHIMSLSPHCTNVLQPLDRTVFGPLNAHYIQ